VPNNLLRCAVCKQRPDEKLAQVTWAWTDAERLRTAVRQRLCVGCYAGRVLALDVPVEPDSDITCVSCGISVEDDLRIVFCTAYVPGAGKLHYQFPFCDEHALIAHQMCRENAIVLQEREVMLGGQAPQREHPSLAAWRALGIEPNEEA
jgi:hypothetical protein